MSSRGTTVVKLRMTPYFWRLLAKYCILLSIRTMGRGGQKMSLMSTVSGIVTTHLERHAKWIEDEFTQVIKEVSLAQASGFPLDYVDAVASAPSEAISDIVRAGRDPLRLAKLLKSVRPLLQLGGPTRSDARRSSTKSRKVRGAGIGLGDSSVANVGAPNARDAQQDRPGSLEQGDVGSEPELLKKAIREFSSTLTTEDAAALKRALEGRQGSK